MAQSHRLTALTPREAVADALYRCVLGLDNQDRDLFESAYVKDESASFVGGGITVQGWNAVSQAFSAVFSLITTHFITNVRVELDESANTAHMTAHAIAYHVRPDEAFKPEDTSYTAGCLYFLNLVKDDTDGLWKIKKWEVKVQWTTGDRTVVHPQT